MGNKIFKETTIIVNERGLHARAAAKVAKLATRYQSTIKISHKGNTACAKDILDLLTLAAAKGSEIEIETYGADDADDAITSITTLIKYGFDEDQSLCPIDGGTA